MGGLSRVTVVGWLLRWARGLRFRTLTFLTLALFAVNLVVPDAIPFVDEILMGLAALVLARQRRDRGAPGAPGPDPLSAAAPSADGTRSKR
jgi:Family of unknown function (DUF6116)